MIDDTPSARERAEAEALARALEGDDEAGAAPADALEIAALLRYAQGRDDASAALLVRARAAARAPQRARSGSIRAVARVAFPIALAAAAVALAYLPLGAPQQAPPAQAPSGEPPRAQTASAGTLRALLDAEAEALARRDAPLEPLLHASAAQRRVLWSELAQRYGAGR
jgi:hypothetical protein